jgi:hypothetical protein
VNKESAEGGERYKSSLKYMKYIELSVYDSVRVSADGNWRVGGMLGWMCNCVYVCMRAELVISVYNTVAQQT